MVRPALRHRLLLNFEGQAEGMTPDKLVARLLEAVPDVDPKLRAEARR
jgi:MoxR-like ATPase